jgi:hypothetical protein
MNPADGHAAPAQPDRWGARWAAVAAALSGVAALLVLFGNLGLLPFLLWLGGLALVLTVACRGAARGLDRRDVLPLVAIAGVAAVFRLWRLGEIPSGPWVDELAAAANAVNLWLKEPFTPFGTTPLFAIGPQWVRTTNLYLYLCQALLWVTGFSSLGVKLISVVPGIAAPPLVYLLARRFLPRTAAFLAGGLLAVSHWHVVDSRWGWDQVLVTALTVAVFSALIKGVREGRPTAFLTAGVLAGLAQYAYAAARVAALAALVFLLLEAALERHRRGLAAVGLFTLGFAQALLPMAAYWAMHPSTFAVREREVNILSHLVAGDLRPLAENIRVYGLMFNVRGDPNPRQNLPDLPMLDPATGALFLIGLAAAVVGWRRPERRAVLLWLTVGLLGGILTEPLGAANSYRVGLVAPACVVLAAIGWEAIETIVRSRVPGLASGLPVAAGAVLALAGALTWVNYFVIRPASRQCWLSVQEGAYCEMLRRSAERTLDAGGAVDLDRGLRWITTTLEFDTLLVRARPAAPLRWVDGRRTTPQELRRAVLFVSARQFEGLPPTLAALPVRPLRTPFGEEPFLALSADRALLAVAAP